jgi:type 1 glutamine amidotransferase
MPDALPPDSYFEVGAEASADGPDVGDGGGGESRSDASGDTEAGIVLPARVLLYHFNSAAGGVPDEPAQLDFFKQLLAGWGYASDDSIDPSVFTDDSLSAYAAVAMINTCFSPFGNGDDGAVESAALQRFLTRGGGLFGTHCAAVTFQAVSPPPLYNQLFGGQEGNGFFDGASACRKIGTHPTIDALPATFNFTGNLDNNQYLFPTTTITLRCQWQAGAMRDVAVSWVRTEGAGRVFYTNLGKVASDLSDPVLGAKHIVPGLAWVLRR